MQTVREPELGPRLKSARVRAGLSHDRLAALVGTSRQHLIRLEKGLHRPTPRIIAGIAEATGTTVEALVGEEHANGDDSEEESETVRLLADLMGRLCDAKLAAALSKAGVA